MKFEQKAAKLAKMGGAKFFSVPPSRGYEVCHRGGLKHSGSSCRTGGNEVTVRTCWSANPQVGFREMLAKNAWSHSPSL